MVSINSKHAFKESPIQKQIKESPGKAKLVILSKALTPLFS